MNLNHLVLLLALLVILGTGISYLVDSKFQLKGRHIAAIFVIGSLLLLFGIPFMAQICFVDGCSLGAAIMTLTPIILGFELLIIGISIPIIRKT